MREESLFKSLEFLRLLSHFEKEKKNNFSIDAPRWRFAEIIGTEQYVANVYTLQQIFSYSSLSFSN